MNRINRKVEYALMALKHMSQKTPGELTTAKEISDSLKTPFDATARVLQLMASKGLLRSEHGATGGYQILRDLAKVTLLELIEMIEGPTAVVKCIKPEGESCEINGSCNIIAPVNYLQNKIHEFYRGINLRELLIETPARMGKRRPFEEVEHGG